MHKTLRKIVAIASLSFFISCSTDVNTYYNFSNIDPECVGINKHFLGIIDNFILQAIEKKEVIGTSAIIVKDGGIAYHKAFGMADVEDTIKMETNTIVAIASMSKLMTIAGAMCHHGRLREWRNYPFISTVMELQIRLPAMVHFP